MCRDNSGGTLSLDDAGEIEVKWPGAGVEAIFKEVLTQAT